MSGAGTSPTRAKSSTLGMPYMPKEVVTPRDAKFTRTEKLPLAGSTTPYQGDKEGNTRLVESTLKFSAKKSRRMKTKELGALGGGPPQQEKFLRQSRPIVKPQDQSLLLAKGFKRAEVKHQALMHTPSPPHEQLLRQPKVQAIAPPSPIHTRFRVPPGERTLGGTMSSSMPNLMDSGRFPPLQTGGPWTPGMSMTGMTGWNSTGNVTGGMAPMGAGHPSMTIFPASYAMPAQKGTTSQLRSTHALKVEPDEFHRTGEFSDKATRRRAFHMLPSTAYAAALTEGVAMEKARVEAMTDEERRTLLYGGKPPSRKGRRGSKGAGRRPGSGGSGTGRRTRPRSGSPSKSASATASGGGMFSSPSPSPTKTRGGASSKAASPPRSRMLPSRKRGNNTEGPASLVRASSERSSGANMFAGGYLDKEGNQNDGAGGVIKHEDKVYELTKYQNRLSHQTGAGMRSTKRLPAMPMASPLGHTVTTEDGDDVAIPAPQQLTSAYSDLLPYADPTSPSKSLRKKEKRFKPKPVPQEEGEEGVDDENLEGGGQDEGNVMHLEEPEPEPEPEVDPYEVTATEVPTVQMVMSGLPHKAPANIPTATPVAPPQLKSTVPVDQGAYVSWRLGDQQPPYAPETHSPIQRIADLQRNRLALQRPGDNGLFDQPSEAEKAMALSMAITLGTPMTTSSSSTGPMFSKTGGSVTVAPSMMTVTPGPPLAMAAQPGFGVPQAPSTPLTPGTPGQPGRPVSAMVPSAGLGATSPDARAVTAPSGNGEGVIPVTPVAGGGGDPSPSPKSKKARMSKAARSKLARATSKAKAVATVAAMVGSAKDGSPLSKSPFLTPPAPAPAPAAADTAAAAATGAPHPTPTPDQTGATTGTPYGMAAALAHGATLTQGSPGVPPAVGVASPAAATAAATATATASPLHRGVVARGSPSTNIPKATSIHEMMERKGADPTQPPPSMIKRSPHAGAGLGSSPAPPPGTPDVRALSGPGGPGGVLAPVTPTTKDKMDAGFKLTLGRTGEVVPAGQDDGSNFADHASATMRFRTDVPAAPDDPRKPKAAGHTLRTLANGMPLHLMVRGDGVDVKVPAADQQFIPVPKDRQPATVTDSGMPVHLLKELEGKPPESPANKRSVMAEVDQLNAQAKQQGWAYAVHDGEGRKVGVLRPDGTTTGMVPAYVQEGGMAADSAGNPLILMDSTGAPAQLSAASAALLQHKLQKRREMGGIDARVPGGILPPDEELDEKALLLIADHETRKAKKRAMPVIRSKKARAAVFVQRNFRGFIVRRNIRILHAGARVLQRWFRGLQGKWALRRDVMELQAIARGARARKELADVRGRLAVRRDARQREQDVLARYSPSNFAPVDEQKADRLRVTHIWRKNEAATTIQKWFKFTQGQKAYYEVVKLAQEEWRYRAAAHLQAVWRGYVVRRDLAWQNWYATLLQRAWRRWFRQKDMWVKLFYLAQRKRYLDVVTCQRFVRGWLARKRFWVFVDMRWAAEKRRMRAEAQHILEVCNEGKATLNDYFKSDRGKKQMKAEANMLRTKLQVKKRERVSRIKGALSDWGKKKKKKPKTRKELEEEPQLPLGLDMDYLLADNTTPDEVEDPLQYEAFDRYYGSTQGLGRGAWGAFAGEGVAVPTERLVWEGERAIPVSNAERRAQAIRDAENAERRADDATAVTDELDEARVGAFGSQAGAPWDDDEDAPDADDHKKPPKFVTGYGPSAKDAQNPFSNKDKGGKGEFKSGAGGGAGAGAGGHGGTGLSLVELDKARSVKDIEEEIMLRDTFETFDVEERGGLDEGLLGLIMRQLSIPFTEDEIHEAFLNLDEDSNGYIECQEFINFFRRSTSEVSQKEGKTGVGYKLTRMRNKMLGNSLLGAVFQMSTVYKLLAQRMIIGREMKRLGEKARRDFRGIYPAPHECLTCNETFVLRSELVRHVKFGCIVERKRERLLAEQERAQRRLQAAVGRRLREVIQIKPRSTKPSAKK